MSQAALNAERSIRKEAGHSRSNGFRLVGFIFLLMVAGIILGTGWTIVNWLKDVNRLQLSKLMVTGERYYTTLDDIHQIIRAAGSPGTFITQDVNVILQHITRLPWIKQASIRKQWPDKLQIHLVEYVPVARWNDIYMVDINGKSFGVPANRHDDLILPLLYGPQGREQDVLAGYLALNTLLIANTLTPERLIMSARDSWQLVLRNGIRLELGREDTIGRLQRFLDLYPILQKTGRRVSYVDLRYDTGAAVGWTLPSVDEQQHNPVQVKQQ